MLDFPNSPSVGQVFTSGNSSWLWDGTKWVAAGSSGAGSIYLPLTGGTLTGPLTVQGALVAGGAGGTLDNTVIGGNTPAAASFTSINGGQLAGNRNRIINGDMRFDLRHSGAVVVCNTNATFYITDRFAVSLGSTSYNFSAQQAAYAAYPGNASYALAAANQAVYTPAAADYSCLLHRIEGANIADLNWGTGAARPVRLSFWAYSSLGGQHSGALTNADGSLSYPFSYTLVAATWTYVVIAIPGPTTGTWKVDNSIGIQITWDLGSGTTLRKTAGSWQAVNAIGVTGSVNVCGTASATLYITAVQFEAGIIATPFEWRDYGSEFLRCQRYYAFPIAGHGLGLATAVNQYLSTTLNFPVSMRSANPTVTWLGNYVAPTNCGNPTVDTATALGARAWVQSTATGTMAFSSYFSASAEL